MNRSQIRASINGANNAIQHINRAISNTEDENGCLRESTAEVENGYQGASSSDLDVKILNYTREVGRQSDELRREIRSIQSIISDLEYLDRQLEEQERRERERREREEREARERASRERMRR